MPREKQCRQIVGQWWHKNVPPRFQGARLRNVGQRDQLQQWIDDAEDWCLVLHGSAGAGKTFASYAAIGEVYVVQCLAMDEGYEHTVEPPLVYSVPTLVIQLQREAAKDVKHTLFDKLRQYDGPLLMDDLGAEKTTEFVAQQIYAILNEREAHYRKTIVTSNLSIAEIAERFSDRVASRFSSGTIIEWIGTDMRLQPPTEEGR